MSDDRSSKPDPDRARSTDLTGEEQGREPASQDDLDSASSSSSSSNAPTSTVSWSSSPPEQTPQRPVSTQGAAAVDVAAVPIDAALEVEELDADLFRSKRLWQPARARGVFGGQVIGMGVATAARTIRPEMTLHSLHCYFLLAGNRDRPILYKVTRVRDGGSYSTRQVHAQQNGKVIFTMMLSYQVPEPLQPTFAIPLPIPAGSAEEGSDAEADGRGRTVSTPPSTNVLPSTSSFTRSPTPNSVLEMLPSPEDSPLNEQRYVNVLQRYGSDLPSKLRATLEAWISDRRKSPVEIRDALPGMYDSNGLPSEGYEQAFWLRSKEPISGGQEMQKAALAYASDFQFLSTVPKALHNSPNIKMMASLDHSMWFYNDFRADEWLLFVMQTQAAGHGRGVALGRIYRRDGVLVAVVAQEGMVRENTERKRAKEAKSKL